MNSHALWRVAAAIMLVVFLALKLFALEPVRQISITEMNDNLAKLLSENAVGPVVQSRQPRRSEVYEFEFRLTDCQSPYIALQGGTLEDLQLLMVAAGPLPENLRPHIIYLGHELQIDDRLGLKFTAVQQFLLHRLGLSAERPSGYLYILLAAPDCHGYQKLDWRSVWATG